MKKCQLRPAREGARVPRYKGWAVFLRKIKDMNVNYVCLVFFLIPSQILLRVYPNEI